MARFAPMPRARVRTTVRANPGALRSWRTTYGKSCDNVICLSLGLPVRHHCSGELGSRNAIIIIVTQPVEYPAALATPDSIGNAWRLGVQRPAPTAFRRFRDIYLKNYTSTPPGIINFWLGWAGEGTSDLYDKIRPDVAFRQEVAAWAGSFPNAKS
jgi:hypothetical protein